MYYPIIFLLTVLYCTSAKQFCDSGEDCLWTVQSGFQVLDVASLEDAFCSGSNPCNDIANIKDTVLYLNVSGDTRGVVQNQWIEGNLNANPCIILHLYTRATAVVITLKTITNDGETLEQSETVKRNVLWHDVTLSYKNPTEKYKLFIDVSSKATSGALIISNITVNQQCTNGIEVEQCPSKEKFMCDDKSCVAWQRVCDFQEDCSNGEDEQICDNLPSLVRCTFENGTCGWKQDEHFDGFNWNLHKGPKAPYTTGPKVDHTTGTGDGYYMHIDSGAPSGYFEPAVLQSPVMPAFKEEFKDICKLRFTYHMLGKDVNKLNIQLVDVCAKRKIDIWSKSGSQGDEWNAAEISISGVSSRYLINIEGYGGHSEHGDIAIDDVSFSPECLGIPHDENGFLFVSCYEKPLPLVEFRNKPDFYCNSNKVSPETKAIANSVITSDTNKSEDISCSSTEQFLCENVTCVPWSQVCNLERNCLNGKDEEICDNLPEHARCTFENGMCGWKQRIHTEGFTWKLHQGPTATRGTGPTADHTKGTIEGHYMYIDGGKGEAHEHATLHGLIMPVVNQSFQDNCKFRFFYHMRGEDVTELNIGVVDACTEVKTHLWSRQSKQGDEWVYDEISLAGITSRYLVEIEAYGAVLEHGDIAIDDISFSPECFGISHDENGCMSPTIYKPLSVREFRNNTDTYCVTPQDIYSTISSPIYTEEQEEKIGTAYVIAITLAAVAVAIIMGSTLLCLALQRQKKNPAQTPRLEMVSTVSDDNTPPVQSSTIDMQLRCAVTELNPNYDFIIAKYPEQQLREIPRNKLKLVRLLGQGAFGEVYEGRLKNLCANVSELQVAVKRELLKRGKIKKNLNIWKKLPLTVVGRFVLERENCIYKSHSSLTSALVYIMWESSQSLAEKLTLPALSTEQAETDFLMEAVIISKFMHKNVVKCLGVCFEEHPRYIILELLDGGDLRTFLRDSRTKGDHICTLTMEDLLKLSLDIANGCRHLEEKHFVHRDIAARNCLLTSRGPDRIAKIADFGMSRDIYSADYYRKDGKAMLPVKWMPPEAFLDGVFTSKTDTWAYGVLLWEIFTLGYMPYPGQTNSDVMHFVASGGRLDPPEKCPARLSKIMIMCWNSVADIRPSFGEIIDLLDMCLQDEEVLNTDVSVCQFPLSECFKDASTLAKTPSTTEDTDDKSYDGQLDGASGTAAEFRGHFESQSREPLLLSSPEI